MFLDANVLFSAAYAPGNRFLRLWQLEGVQLLTSAYALEEARRNLQQAEQQERLDRLTESLEVPKVSLISLMPAIAAEVNLPEKDYPILAGAVQTRATHLLTGDVRHFGPYLGETVKGVLIQTPAQYFHEKEG